MQFAERLPRDCLNCETHTTSESTQEQAVLKSTGAWLVILIPSWRLVHGEGRNGWSKAGIEIALVNDLASTLSVQQKKGYVRTWQTTATTAAPRTTRTMTMTLLSGSTSRKQCNKSSSSFYTTHDGHSFCRDGACCHHVRGRDCV